MSSLNLHNNPARWGNAFPFYRWWNCGLERLTTLHRTERQMESQDSHFKCCLSGGSGFSTKLENWCGQGRRGHSSQVPSPVLQRIATSSSFAKPLFVDAERREARGRIGGERWLNHLKSVLKISIFKCFLFLTMVDSVRDTSPFSEPTE